MRRSVPESIHKLYGRQRDRYLELIYRFPLRPIRDDAELHAAVEVVNSLIDQNKLTAAEDDYLDVLSDLVENYENEAVPMRPVCDADLLRYLLSLRGESQVDVAKQTRIAESTISEVLAGKRRLNRSQIGKLAGHFKVSPSVFAFSEIH